MARKGTRKGRRGLVGYLYNPVREALGVVKNTANGATNTVKKVVRNSIKGVDTLGRKTARRANNTIRGLVPKRLLKGLTRRRRRN
jgi:hypothetical protein